MDHMIYGMKEPFPSFLQTSSSLGRNLFKNAGWEDTLSTTLTATRVPFETVSSEPPNFDVDDVLSRLKIKISCEFSAVFMIHNLWLTIRHKRFRKYHVQSP